MRLRYNSPVVLTFALLCALVLILDQYIWHSLAERFFSVPGHGSWSARDPLDWFRLVSHPLGHRSWAHLLGNMTIILLVGPMLEERHGGKSLILMMLVTALVTAVLNVLFFSHGLMGASGIAFMMILLSSFVNKGKGDIPLSFVLVAALFLGKEFAALGDSNDVSEFAHIIGGVMGAVFGFTRK